MDSFGKLIGLYDKVGVGGMFAGMLAVFICMFLYDIFKKFGDVLIDRFFRKFKRGNIDLEKHEVFTRIKLSMEHKIPKMKIYCPLRKRIFKKILNIQYTTMTDYMYKVAKSDIDLMTNEQFKHFWTNIFVEISSVFEERCEASEVPKIAYEKFKEFNTFNEELMRKTMYQICDAEMIYDNNVEKTFAIMDFVSAILDISLLSAEKTIDSLNGELSNVAFEGVECTGCTEGCPLKKEHDE